MNDENSYLTKTEKSLLQRIGSFFHGIQVVVMKSPICSEVRKMNQL